MRFRKSAEFNVWYLLLKEKEQGYVDSRLYRIEEYHHFGDTKYLGDNLMELRWANGMRIYFMHEIDSQGNSVLLILGGFKNAQKKDIKKARILVTKYSTGKT